jgi:Tfp pilus assembly PilM family ATPase/Tfp pilus assembly protein PilN
MAEFIALDWEKRTLNGLEATASKGRVRVRRCFELTWPTFDSDDAANNRQTGEWLKGELARLGIAARKVLVSLPREEVVVRQIDVPDVPDEELPDLVRLQAETRISTSLDSLVLDFLPLPRVEGDTSRAVLMFTFDREKLDVLHEVVRAAGLELEQVAVSSVATAELVARTERDRNLASDDTTLTVARDGKRIEISLMRSRHLLFTHSTQLTGSDVQQDSHLAAAEIRRALGAHSQADAGNSVARAWVVGSENEQQTLRQTMADHLDCDVDMIDPLAGQDVSIVSDVSSRQDVNASPEAKPGEDVFMLDEGDALSHTPFGAPLGLLMAAGQPMIEAVDFLNPRKAIVRPDRRKQKIGLIAASVVLAIAAAFGATQWWASSLHQDIDDADEQLAEFDRMIKSGRPTVEAANVINEWQTHSDDWLARMTHLNEVLPGTDRIYLQNYRFTPRAGNSAGHVHADGFARSDDDVFDLYQRLSERGYRVQPQSVPRTSKDSEYPYRFQLELDLTIAKTVATPTKNKRAAQ